MDISETIEKLQRIAKLSEMRHVTTFMGFRQDTDGGMHEVTVQVHDAGMLATPGTRYFITIADEAGHVATSNTDDSIEAALHKLHWNALDGCACEPDLHFTAQDDHSRGLAATAHA